MSQAAGKEAVLYVKEGDRVKCTACPRYCKIPQGRIGFCGIRGNVDGRLFLFVYGKVIAANVDPIGKKPVMHYAPGSWVYSIATTGCNFMCQFCQNFDISQRRKVEGVDMNPREVVENAQKTNCQGVAYTYNEPSIFLEFARDCGVLARKKGLFNVFVSNGYGTPESVGMMKEFLDCITVDFKGNAELKFVRRYIGIPDPQPIFDTIREIRDKTNIHIELTDLVVPEVGDNLEEAKKLAKFVYDELGPDMPIQFLRFYPDYKMMDYAPTSIEMLEKHYEIAKSAGLRYVYVGNVPGHKWSHTYCPGCNSMVVGRFGAFITKWELDKNNRCSKCGYQIPIIGQLKEPLFNFRFA